MRKITFLMAFVACAIFANAENLILNPSFEDDMDHWTPNHPELVCTISSDAHTGVKALLVEHGNTTYNNRVIADALNLGAGTYTISAYAKNANSTAAAIKLGYVPVGGEASDYKYSDLLTLTNDYAEYTFRFTLSTAGQFNILIMAPKAANVPQNGAYAFLLDDVSLTVSTGFANTNAEKLNLFVINKTLMVQGIADGTMVEVYTVTGARVLAQELVNGQIQLDNLSKGIYVVRAGNEKCKIVL